ncbi:hypothetical protein C5167_032977, partial [Papaver somniferum]
MVMILIHIILVFKIFLGVDTIQETEEIINEMKENDPMRLLNLKVLRIVCRTVHTVYVYIDPGFTSECYRNAYSHPAALIPDVKKPNEVDESTKINAPSVIKGLGRQKKIGIYLVLRSQERNGCV